MLKHYVYCRGNEKLLFQAKNDYVVQEVESPFNYGGYVYSLMRGELALSLPTVSILNYIILICIK